MLMSSLDFENIKNFYGVEAANLSYFLFKIELQSE